MGTSVTVARVLKFRDKLDLFRRMKSLKVGDLANLCGLTADRMEDILEGKHAPCAADVLRIMAGLGITFEPEDFES